MSISEIIRGVLSFGGALAILPAAFLCYIPMKNQIRFPWRHLVWQCSIILIIGVVYLGLAFRYFEGITQNLPLAIYLIFCFLYYCWTVYAERLQCLAVFTTVCTMYAIPSYAAIYISSMAYIRYAQDNAVLEGLFQTGLILVITPLVGYVLWKYGGFIVDRIKNRWVWGIASIVNVLFFAVLCIMVPQDESLLAVPELRRAYLTVFLLISIAYILIVIFFATACREMILAEDLRIKSIVYHTQQKQLDEVVEQMEKLRVFRHDMRHSLNVIRQMAADGDTEEILKYINSVDSKIPGAASTVYCQNAVLNAILNFYRDKAQQSATDLRLSIDLPAKISEEQEDDLLWILGNLLENAQLGCMTVPEDERFIKLDVRTINKVNLYLVATNSFDGHVRKRGRVYQTTRSGREGSGAGIGLASIRSLVDKYGGILRVYHKGRTFYVDLSMNLK